MEDGTSEGTERSGVGEWEEFATPEDELRKGRTNLATVDSEGG